MSEYQFIRMVTGEKPRTWYVLNKRHGDLLGTVAYYPAWRQFTFDAESGCTFSAGCLRDVAAFMEEQRKARRSPSGQLSLRVLPLEVP